ncbi:MAG: cache domain-containing protein [Candidatus Aureabacteria bacterium]|nr:cache domain-containing protein [Candidatus Auribacterota bacterium]
MKPIKLKIKIMLSILYVIIFLGLCMSVFGYFVLKKYVYESAQEKVVKDLEIVRDAYDQKLKEMKLAFNMINEANDLGLMREYLHLDYLYWVPISKIDEESSEIIKKVLNSAQDTGGTRIISKKQISRLFAGIEGIKIKPTPKACPTDKKLLESIMSIEYAKPYLNAKGKIEKILVGGKLINKNFQFIDNIVNTVFENRLYEGKPVGTITLFQNDVRIATNVLDKNGKRAIGTRVSEVVYKRIFEQKEKWLDRAFVVTDWYVTAYEPIKNINGNVIGILYVGILEKPFVEFQKNLFIALLIIIFSGCIISIFFSMFISKSIAVPLTKVIKSTNQISNGNLGIKIESETDIYELNELISAVNDMSMTLIHREESLDISNKKLEVLNKSYLDLIGFVSHELKGILSSIILNVYLIRKRILGNISEKQEKTLNSIARNLDYLAVTVKNFLNLSRIEKNEIEINKSQILLKEHIFDVAIEAFEQPLKDKEMYLQNNIAKDLSVNADSALMQIVANNLISNAIKYGKPRGEIVLKSSEKDDVLEIEVYNDGETICDVDIEKLFKKFSRIVYRGMESIKGSGIGLYITKEIIKLHGGTIKVEPSKKGNSFIFSIDKD